MHINKRAIERKYNSHSRSKASLSHFPLKKKIKEKIAEPPTDFQYSTKLSFHVDIGGVHIN